MWFLAFAGPFVFSCYRSGFGRKADGADQATEAAKSQKSSKRRSNDRVLSASIRLFLPVTGVCAAAGIFVGSVLI